MESKHIQAEEKGHVTNVARVLSHASHETDDPLAKHHAHHPVVHLERNFGILSCLGLAFAILNSWTAMSASLPVVMPSGGSVAMVWGLLVSAIGTLMMGLSLAEICHNMPLTGGQYDWTYMLAPASLKPGLSFFVGWNATAGWIALIACNASLTSNFVTGIIALWNESFELQSWQNFLMYLAMTLAFFVLNVFGIRFLPLLDKFAGSWAMAGIVVVSIALLALGSGEYQPAKNVFAQWTNTTGWPDGMAFILGLLQSTFGLTAFDAASHMIEEMPNAAINAPKVMVGSILLGSSTAWIFMVILLFCLTDYEAVLSASTGPLLQIYYQVTHNKAGATCLVIFNTLSMFFAGQGVCTVASRMLMTFARDRGMGRLSPWLADVHPRLKVPVWSLVFCTAWVVVFGLIQLGSSVAVNAILSASVVMLQLSYFVPILLMLIRGDSAFADNPDRVWSLGRARRPINIAALVFLTVTSVIFLLPPSIPVTSGESMNYVIVAVAISMTLSLVVWFSDGRRNYHGPAAVEERLAYARSV